MVTDSSLISVIEYVQRKETNELFRGFINQDYLAFERRGKRTQIVDRVLSRPPNLQWSSSSWPSKLDYEISPKLL